MQIQAANAAKVSEEVLAAILSPPPPVDYLAWAEQNIVFSKRESPMPGPYDSERFAYFSEILRALSPDDPCRIVSLIKSAQLGGTVLANIFTLGTMDMDPGDFLYVHPTDDNARRWSKMKLTPMLKNTTALQGVFPQRARDGHDSVLYKERRDGGGAIQISGANSPASLSQVTMSRQVQDDLAKWDMNAAGDPEVQADTRSQGHEWAKIFKISTPMVVPGCRITRNFEAGSQEELLLPCPHCGHKQTLEWENMLATIDADAPEKACFTCVECEELIEEYHRPKMLQGGEWRAQNPKAKRYHRSFKLWSAYSLLQSFERIARSWIDAVGDPLREQTFFNDVLGLAYKISGEAPPWEDLQKRGAASDYRRGTIPAGFPLVTCGVDCQGSYVEWQVVAWGRDTQRAIIEHGTFEGHISELKCQLALNGLLQQGFRNAYGRNVFVDLLAIDGNAFTEDVWDWAKSHPVSRVIMVRGVGQEAAPMLAKVKREYKRDGTKAKYSRRFYNFASSVMKMALYRNIVKDDPAKRGFVALPTGLEDSFYEGITSETRKRQKTKTGHKYVWVESSTIRNEPLDTHLQAEAAAVKMGVRHLTDKRWDQLFAERETPPEPVQRDFEDLLGGALAVPATPAKASSSKTNRWKKRMNGRRS